LSRKLLKKVLEALPAAELKFRAPEAHEGSVLLSAARYY
jgi:hypothetical protein